MPSGPAAASTQGLPDVMNLGGRLAAVVPDRAGDILLDSYEEERRPWALDVAEHSSRRPL
jgi:2-polyprenyl-6-methoxyphenol hydroxylase-like FAD-dependent oxidoreductase